MSEDRTTITPHPQYTATTTTWLPEPGAPVQQHGPILAACTCVGPHNTEATVKADRVDKQGVAAWIATASGPNPTTAGDRATRVAVALGATLGEGD